MPHRQRIFEISLVFISLFIFYQINIVNVQPASPGFVRSCLDLMVDNHTNNFQHTYCYHACGFLESGIPVSQDTTVCDASGNCVCSFPCTNNVTNTPPVTPISPSLCPPMSTDAPDPDPTALPRCMATCATSCPQGVGMICGEIEVLGTPSAPIYAKICTCQCPIQKCVNATTTTPNPLSFVLLPMKGIIKKKIKFKVLLFKFLKLCWLVLKVGVLYLLNSFVLGVYSWVLYEMVSWEFRQVFNGLNFMVGYFKDFLLSNLI